MISLLAGRLQELSEQRYRLARHPECRSDLAAIETRCDALSGEVKVWMSSLSSKTSCSCGPCSRAEDKNGIAAFESMNTDYLLGYFSWLTRRSAAWRVAISAAFGIVGWHVPNVGTLAGKTMTPAWWHREWPTHQCINVDVIDVSFIAKGAEIAVLRGTDVVFSTIYFLR